MPQKRKNKVNDFDGLNFPVFDQPLPGPPILSMDEYYHFVTNQLRWMGQKGRRMEPASQRFTLN